jgi:HSP20 family protein
MSLIKWSPFLFEPLNAMDQMTDELRSSLIPTGKGGGLIPPVDVYETPEAIMVEAPMAGVDPKNIELSVDRGVLSIKALSERRTEVDEKTYYRKEVRHGAVFRQIPLPAPVQEDQAEASYEQGVLKIRLPKRADSGTTIKITNKPS